MPSTMTFLTTLLLVVIFHMGFNGAFAEPSRRLNPTRPKAFDYAADAERVVGQLNHNFSCDGLEYGYYADQGQQCQVFHICMPVKTATGRILDTFQFSFFCPSQTRFSQDSRTCISEAQAFPCHKAHTLYDLNKAIGHRPKNKKRKPVNLKESFKGNLKSRAPLETSSINSIGASVVTPQTQTSLVENSNFRSSDRTQIEFSIGEDHSQVHTGSSVEIGDPAVNIPTSTGVHTSTNNFEGSSRFSSVPNSSDRLLSSNNFNEELGAPNSLVPPGSQIFSTKSIRHQNVVSKANIHEEGVQNFVGNSNARRPGVDSNGNNNRVLSGLSNSDSLSQTSSFAKSSITSKIEGTNNAPTPTPRSSLTTVNVISNSRNNNRNNGNNAFGLTNAGDRSDGISTVVTSIPPRTSSHQSTQSITSNNANLNSHQNGNRFSNSHANGAPSIERVNNVSSLKEDKKISTFADRARAHTAQINSQIINEQILQSNSHQGNGVSSSNNGESSRKLSLTTKEPVKSTQAFVTNNPTPTISQKFTPPPPASVSHSKVSKPLQIPGFSSGVVRTQQKTQEDLSFTVKGPVTRPISPITTTEYYNEDEIQSISVTHATNEVQGTGSFRNQGTISRNVINQQNYNLASNTERSNSRQNNDVNTRNSIITSLLNTSKARANSNSNFGQQNSGVSSVSFEIDHNHEHAANIDQSSASRSTGNNEISTSNLSSNIHKSTSNSAGNSRISGSNSIRNGPFSSSRSSNNVQSSSASPTHTSSNVGTSSTSFSSNSGSISSGNAFKNTEANQSSTSGSGNSQITTSNSSGNNRISASNSSRRNQSSSSRFSGRNQSVSSNSVASPSSSSNQSSSNTVRASSSLSSNGAVTTTGQRGTEINQSTASRSSGNNRISAANSSRRSQSSSSRISGRNQSVSSNSVASPSSSSNQNSLNTVRASSSLTSNGALTSTGQIDTEINQSTASRSSGNNRISASNSSRRNQSSSSRISGRNQSVSSNSVASVSSSSNENSSNSGRASSSPSSNGAVTNTGQISAEISQSTASRSSGNRQISTSNSAGNNKILTSNSSGNIHISTSESSGNRQFSSSRSSGRNQQVSSSRIQSPHRSSGHISTDSGISSESLSLNSEHITSKNSLKSIDESQFRRGSTGSSVSRTLRTQKHQADSGIASLTESNIQSTNNQVAQRISSHLPTTPSPRVSVTRNRGSKKFQPPAYLLQTLGHSSSRSGNFNRNTQTRVSHSGITSNSPHSNTKINKSTTHNREEKTGTFESEKNYVSENSKISVDRISRLNNSGNVRTDQSRRLGNSQSVNNGRISSHSNNEESINKQTSSAKEITAQNSFTSASGFISNENEHQANEASQNRKSSLSNNNQRTSVSKDSSTINSSNLRSISLTNIKQKVRQQQTRVTTETPKSIRQPTIARTSQLSTTDNTQTSKSTKLQTISSQTQSSIRRGSQIKTNISPNPSPRINIDSERSGVRNVIKKKIKINGRPGSRRNQESETKSNVDQTQLKAKDTTDDTLRQRALDALANFSPGLANANILSIRIIPNKPKQNEKETPNTNQQLTTKTSVREASRRGSSRQNTSNIQRNNDETPNPRVRTRVSSRRISKPVVQSSSSDLVSNHTSTTTSKATGIPAPRQGTVSKGNSIGRTRTSSRRFSRPVQENLASTTSTTTENPVTRVTTRVRSRGRSRFSTQRPSKLVTQSTQTASNVKQTKERLSTNSSTQTKSTSDTSVSSAQSTKEDNTRIRGSVSSRRRVLKKVTPLSSNTSSSKLSGFSSTNSSSFVDISKVSSNSLEGKSNNNTTTINQTSEKPTGTLRVVGTRIETSVSTIKGRESNARKSSSSSSIVSSSSSSNNNLNRRTSTSSSSGRNINRRVILKRPTIQKPLTDLELEALSAIAQVNSAFVSAARTQNSATPAKRRITSARLRSRST